MTASSPLMLLYDNVAPAGNLSLGSWAVPLTNLQDPRPTKFARSTDLQLSSTKFLMTLQQGLTFRAVFIGATNLNQSGKYRVRAYIDSSLATNVYDSGWDSVGADRSFDLVWGDPYFWTGRVSRSDPDGVGLDIPVLFGDSVSARYWLFEFDNGANAAGYIKIGTLYMGTPFTPAINFAPGATLKKLTKTKVKEAAAGTPYFKRRRSYRQFTPSFPIAPSSEALNSYWKLVDISNLNKPIVVIIDPDDTANLDRKSFYARLEELPSFSFENIDMMPTSLLITEYI